MQIDFFRIEVDFWEKSATKFLCENFRRQSCKSFTSLSNSAQMVGGGCPLPREILGQIGWPTPFKNGNFQSIFARSASAVILVKKFNYHH